MPVLEKYSITDFRDEVCALIERGRLGRHQRIYELRGYFDARQWQNIEQILNLNEYLLRDEITDLVGSESWTND